MVAINSTYEVLVDEEQRPGYDVEWQNYHNIPSSNTHSHQQSAYTNSSPGTHSRAYQDNGINCLLGHPQVGHSTKRPADETPPVGKRRCRHDNPSSPASDYIPSNDAFPAYFQHAGHNDAYNAPRQPGLAPLPNESDLKDEIMNAVLDILKNRGVTKVELDAVVSNLSFGDSGISRLVTRCINALKDTRKGKEKKN